MGNRTNRSVARTSVIDPEKFGVSFSIKQCRDFKIDPEQALSFLIENMGFRRFRLMSYWNEHEKEQGRYTFDTLDTQIKLVAKVKGVVTLCLGVRQPRWPESHWPEWALALPQNERYEALYRYLETVVQRYKNQNIIISWQLENEALNRGFGKQGDFNRARLRHEYALIEKIDSSRPIIMTTSNTWGIPLRHPRPTLFGFTFYQVQFENGAYRHTLLPAWWWKVRAKIIQYMVGRGSFIHELQAEPWGLKAIWEMSVEEQSKSMNTAQLMTNITLAKSTALYPIDLWGGEWWYWRYLQDDSTLVDTVKNLLQD